MQEGLTRVDASTVELIGKTVRESMAAFGFRMAHVRAGEDHDGDPVIFIEAEYDLTETPIDIEVMAKLRRILRSRLRESGETRFPHIRHNFDERQQVANPRRKRA